MDRAFWDITDALCQEPFIFYFFPDFDKSFILQTDASDISIKTVLLRGTQGDRNPIAYISCKLFPQEVQYLIDEKECLAIKGALDIFKYYLLGWEFVLESIHKSTTLDELYEEFKC